MYRRRRPFDRRQRLFDGISRYDEPRGFNWAVDYELFDDVLWPGLALRIKAFEAVKLQRAWSCHYDQNSLDANMILDSWPGKLDNFYIACGLSGHGLHMHRPSAGPSGAHFGR